MRNKFLLSAMEKRWKTGES